MIIAFVSAYFMVLGYVILEMQYRISIVIGDTIRDAIYFLCMQLHDLCFPLSITSVMLLIVSVVTFLTLPMPRVSLSTPSFPSPVVWFVPPPIGFTMPVGFPMSVGFPHIINVISRKNWIGQDCCICLNTFKIDDDALTWWCNRGCGQSIHQSCFEQHFESQKAEEHRNFCPLCRHVY
jgi:Ring finger domain